MRPAVSLTMIARNEAANLPRALGSVVGLVDEIVVVDTGSTDDTPDVAARLGARVIHSGWTDSFAAARNVATRAARGDWVFWLDADEWLEPADRERFSALRGRLATAPVVYFMRQVSPLAGAGAGTLAVAQPRLFRAGSDLVWEYRVHEQVLPSCLRRGDRVADTDVVISHSGYATAGPSREKSERNRRLLRLELADRPDDPYVLLLLARAEIEESPVRAVAVLRRALSLLRRGDPLRRQAFALLVRAATAAGGSGDEALADGLREFPDDTAILSEAGVAAVSRRDLTGAEAAFRRLLSQPPHPDEYLGAVDLSLRGWQTRHHLAVVLRDQGRLDEAEAEWRAGLAEKPDAALLWLGLAELYLLGRRWAEADEALGRFEAVAPHSADTDPDDADRLRARALLLRGDHAAAVEVLRRLVGRSPGSADLRRMLALALERSGDLDGAERELRALAAGSPRGDEVRQALAALLWSRRG